MKIAVLYGGVSKEREVSLSSGKGIINALKENGHEVIGIDFNPSRMSEVIDLDVDLVFIGLHGKFGEDGCVQGLLDMLNIPYVGSGVLASSLAMDKYKAKKMFQSVDIPIADSKLYVLKDTLEIEATIKDIEQHFKPPFVIKPNREGSTLGLTIVKENSQIRQALEYAMDSDPSILVETFIDGIELTVPVIGEENAEYAYPIIEIVPKNDLYDYESKYAEGGSEHIIPARISEDQTKLIQEYAVKAHQVLGCSVYSRADFLLTNEGTAYILEVNTLPGMTPTSLFPDAAKEVDLTYNEMIEEIVQLSHK